MQMFQEQVAAMNRTYGLFINWPTPSGYNFWYQSLPQEYHPYYATPSDYNLFYYQASKMFSNTAKPPKLSRNQRRKQKLNLLKAELQDQTKKIGNWVKLQRKDLIQNIQRIEKKEQKIKNKRKDKLSHLIQIHREVFKHYKAKCQIKDPKKNRRVDPENNKKRLSFIKRMKVLFQNKIQQNKIQRQKAKATENIVQEEGFLTESESESDKQDEKKVEIKQDVKKKIIQKYSNNDINKIEYSTIGKLTGKNYHEISLREWCKNVPSEQLEDITLQIINRLAYKQAIRKIQKPNKAKKLIVSGIKQCRRTLDTIIDKKRSRILIIALNIQRNNLQKGVDDQVQKNILLAEKINIPIINISTRSKLGRAFTGKFGPRITMLSIINYQGYQDMVQKMLDKWEQGCKQYNRL